MYIAYAPPPHFMIIHFLHLHVHPFAVYCGFHHFHKRFFFFFSVVLCLALCMLPNNGTSLYGGPGLPLHISWLWPHHTLALSGCLHAVVSLHLSSKAEDMHLRLGSAR